MKRLILPMVLVMSLSAVFNRYISNFKRIVVPNIFENIFPKLANLGAFSLFFFLGASEKISYAFFLGVFVLGLIGYVSIFIFQSDLDYYGKLRYILPAAQMYMTVVVFGLSFSNVYFYGRYRDWEIGRAHV